MYKKKVIPNIPKIGMKVVANLTQYKADQSITLQLHKFV